MHRKRRMWMLCAMVSFCAALVGCAQEDATGNAQVSLQGQKLEASDVARVELTIHGPGMSLLTASLEETGTRWTGGIGNIPVGTDRTFNAQAFDASNTVIYEGQVTGVTIEAAQTAAVLLQLQQRTPPTAFQNSAPRISGVAASAYQVRSNQAVALSLTATDADADVLAYSWTATGGAFGDALVASPTWTAPATPGTYALNVVVSDGRGGQAGVTLNVVVLEAVGAANVAVSFNTWPVVAQMTGTPFGQVGPGGTVTLDVGAVDADGDALAYAWSDDCGGAFSNTATARSTWAAPSPAPVGGLCRLTVAVVDGRGGSTTGTMGLNVVLLQLPTLPPVIGQVFQSAAQVRPGDTMHLFATASDPEGESLTFTWSASQGTLGAPVTSASRSDVTWTAPADSGVMDTDITLEVQDASGQRTTQHFTVRLQVCIQAVTSYLKQVNSSTSPLTVAYSMVGGGGGGDGLSPGGRGVVV
ncbi:Ig-like domain-containing protein, partial [Corallococcus praedator]|uniref:Ig-like domain-containing protein n=1 Tax=Corallococcus praedator TaxID=2316724 RepID=UPI003F6DC06A